MNKLAHGITLVAVLLSTGCKNTADSGTAKVDSNEKKVDLVCEYTRKTGSNLKTKTCMTIAQKKHEKERARLDMAKVRQVSALSSGSTSQ